MQDSFSISGAPMSLRTAHRIEHATFPITELYTITCSCCTCPTKRILAACNGHVAGLGSAGIEEAWRAHRIAFKAGEARQARGYLYGGAFQ